MSTNPAQQIHSQGQSVWYDNISRELITNGELSRIVQEWGVRGMTSNPSIFDVALKKGNAYDGQVLSLKNKDLSPEALFDELALEDIAWAADILLPVYRDSDGTDGFVSLEVSPLLARDSNKTIEQARILNDRLSRPNVMIKIPGTPECLPAIKQCLEDGININVTLLFSVENYIQVAKTYCEALNNRLAKGLPVKEIRSVASFFVSRVDTIVDSALEKVGSPEALSLKSKFGIANCKLAYEQFEKIFNGIDFADLKKAGAKVQRPLWASTSTKSPELKDTLYVEELIGPETVNTMPHATLVAVVEHGSISSGTISKGLDEAHAVQQKLSDLGLDLNALMDELQVDGVNKFADSFASLISSVEGKQKALK